MSQTKIGTVKYLGKDYSIFAVKKQWRNIVYRNKSFYVKEEYAHNISNIQILYDEFCKNKLEKIIKQYILKLSNKTIPIRLLYTDGSYKVEKMSINTYLQKAGYKPCDYKIGNYKGSWGINEPVLKNKQFILHFNLSLIKFDSGHKIGYVVAHELAHVVERNHNKSFYRLVERLYPGARRYERFWNTR